MRVNLGAGSMPEPNWVNVDSFPLPGIDVVHDLDTTPWPFEDNSVERIKAFDVFEHVVNWRGFMQECHRILVPDGILYIHTSYYKNPGSYRDPDHKRFLHEESFDYWVPGTYFNQRYGPAYAGGRHFRKLDVHLDTPVGDLNVTLQKIEE